MRKDEVRNKKNISRGLLRALALTESTHSLQSELNFGLGSSDSKGLREFLELHSINWLASSTVPASQRVTVPAFISPYA